MTELARMTLSRRRRRGSFATHPMRPPDRKHRALRQGLHAKSGWLRIPGTFEHQNFARERQ
jgi:hypothetical protein